MDLWVKFGITLIGTIIGGSLIALMNGYYSKRGERAAIRELMPEILKQARLTAYEEETGKRLATHDDIDNILKEVRLVTKETESIRAVIGIDLWTRQMIWQQKREGYSNLLKAISTYSITVWRHKGENSLALLSYDDLVSTWIQASFFLAEEVEEQVRGMIREIGDVLIAGQNGQNEADQKTDRTKILNLLTDTRKVILSAGKKDLFENVSRA